MSERPEYTAPARPRRVTRRYNDSAVRPSTFAVLLGSVALALAQLWPLPFQLATATFAHRDAILNAGIFGLVTRQLTVAPWRPFDVNMYFPYREALAAVDPQISSALLVAPVTWTWGPVAGHNLFVAISFAAAAFGTCRLLRALGGSWAAGLVAGVVFAYSPFRFDHLNHSHVLAGCWLPFLLTSVYRLSVRPTWRAALASLGWFMVLAWASWYLTVIALVAVAVLTLALLVSGRVTVARGHARAVVVAMVAALALVPLLRPYLAIPREFDPVVRLSWQVPESIAAEPPSFRDRVAGPVATTGALWENAAGLESYLAASTGTPVPWLRPLTRFATPEAAFFPGVVGLLLAAWGVLTWARRHRAGAWLVANAVAIGLLALIATLAARSGSPAALVRLAAALHVVLWAPAVIAAWALVHARRRAPSTAGDGIDDRAAIALLAVGIVGWALSLGPEPRVFGVSLGAGLYPADLPPFNLLRAPARFGILWVLSVAVWSGIGLAEVVARIRQLRVARPAVLASAIGAVAIVAAVVELTAVPIALLPIHRVDAAVMARLGTEPPAPLVAFPIHDNLWALLDHWRWRGPLINGSGLREPTAYAGLHGRNGLTPDMVEHLRTWFHPGYLLVDFSLYDPAQRAVVTANLQASADGLTLLDEHGDARLYAVRDRSRGQRITRVYTGGMLTGRKGIFIEGAIDALDSTVARRLTASIDGRPVQEWDADQVGERRLLYLPLPATRGDVVSLELVSDYTVKAGDRRPTIGSTGVTAMVDVSVHAAAEQTELRVNGGLWAGAKGYTIVVLDASGRPADVRNFNTSWSTDDASAMATFLRGVPAGRVVIVASTYDVSRSLTADAVEALRQIGLSADLRGKEGWAHCGIGVAQAAAGTAIESTGATAADCRVGQLRSADMTVTRVQPF